MGFRVLGPIEVSGPDGTLRLGGRKEQTVLAALVADAGHVVSVDRLCEILWGDDQPATAVRTLRSYVSRLRSRLRPLTAEIRTVSAGYVLDIPDQQVDARVFEELVAEAHRLMDHGNHPEVARILKRALALWRGPPYHGLDDHDFAHMEAIRLEERRAEAIELQQEALLALGRHESAIGSLEKLVEQYPLRERLWRSLMIALYRSGRQAEALRAYRRAHEILGKELGIEPSRELRDLEESILLQRPGMEAPNTPKHHFSNLPEARTSFIGREDDLAEIESLLGQYRCVTILGAGGSGKTRLAIETARKVTYGNGVVLVELAGLGDPNLVPDHVAAALGDVGSHADDALDAIAGYLADSELLLLLDNCEHLINAAADFIDSILDRCPRVRVLATSREPLRTEGEALFIAPPLDVPALDQRPEEQEAAEATRLFLDRVRAHDREFSVDDRNRDDIVTICRSLDGIPLALELAAARSRTMSIAEISRGMDDRFQVLTEGRRTAPQRHQTLKAAIDWSYDLCGPDAQTALRRLSVFSGSFSPGAAVAVVEAPPIASDEVGELLSRLVDKSLIERAVSEGESRFRLLETIRQYAFDALATEGDAAATRRRHRDWYLSVAEQATAELRGRDQVTWWKRLDADHDNLRSALEWSFSNRQLPQGFRLVAALGWYWFMRAHWREAWRWTSRCIELGPEADPLAWARVIHAAGSIEVIRGNLTPLDEPLRQALEISREAGSPIDEAWCLHYRGHAAGFRAASDARPLMEAGLAIFEDVAEPWAEGWSWRYIGQVMDEVDDQIAYQERALDRFLELGDRWCASYSLYLLGNTHLANGRIEEAITANSRSRSIAEELDDTIWYAHATGRLGIAARFEGQADRALALLDEAIDLHQRIGDDNCVSVLRGHRGLALADLGDPNRGVTSIAQALDGWRKLDSRLGTMVHLGFLAEVLFRSGDSDNAARLLGASAAAAADVPESQWSIYRAMRSELSVSLESDLGESAYRRLFEEGEHLGLEGARDGAIERYPVEGFTG